ncbi:MAG: exosortase F system-associated protein [Bacteroidetes bacterium]|nr:exosortase F system-associated protein [Bacteroidota bacterium]
MNKILEDPKLNRLLLAISVSGIALTFLFQEFSFVDAFHLSENLKFITKKILRVLLNDFFMLIFIIAWFKDWRITRLAIAIQLIDGLILLPIYLAIKLSVEGSSEISSPLLSQFHRLIINPTLMILLIPAVYFQKFSARG